MITKDDLRRQINSQGKVIKYYQFLVIRLLGGNGASISQDGEVTVTVSSEKSVKIITDLLTIYGFEDVVTIKHDDGLSPYSVVFRINSIYM